MPRFLRQFGLRTLLLFCTLAAVCFGLWRWHMSWVDRQFDLAEQIGAAKGTVGWETWGPSWLHETFGSRYFSHITSVDWHHKRIKDEQLALLREISTLEYLYVAGNRMITDEGMKVVDHLPNLRVMAIWSTSLTDKTMARIGKLKGLEVLDFQRTKITEEGLEHLRGAPNVVTLIHSLQLTDVGLDHLASIPHLKQDHLRCTGLTDRGIEVIRDRFEITNLSLSRPQGEHWADLLVDHPTLNRLWVSRGTMTDEQFSRFLRESQLSELSLVLVPVSDDGLVDVGNMVPNLTLSLNETKVTIPGLLAKVGSDARHLTLTRNRKDVPGELDLSIPNSGVSVHWRGDLKQQDFYHFHHCQNARTIDIVSHASSYLRYEAMLLRNRIAPDPPNPPTEAPFGLDDKALRTMGQLPSLVGVRVAGIQAFSPDGLRSLAKANALTHLTLTGTKLNDDYLAALSSFTNLQVLNLSYNPITNEGLKQLRKLQNLRELNISECRKLDSEAGRWISQLKNLQTLIATWTTIGDEGLQHLHGMPKLAEVNAYGDGITPAGLQKLKASLPTLQPVAGNGMPLELRPNDLN